MIYKIGFLPFFNIILSPEIAAVGTENVYKRFEEYISKEAILEEAEIE